MCKTRYSNEDREEFVKLALEGHSIQSLEHWYRCVEDHSQMGELDWK